MRDGQLLEKQEIDKMYEYTSIDLDRTEWKAAATFLRLSYKGDTMSFVQRRLRGT